MVNCQARATRSTARRSQTIDPLPLPRSAGIVNHLVPAEELEPFTDALAGDIVANAALSIAVMKEELRILDGAHPMSSQGWGRVRGTRRPVYDSADTVEGLKAFKEKR